MKGKKRSMITKVVNEQGEEIPVLRRIYSFEETVILSMRADKHVRLKILKLVRRYLIKREKEIKKYL